MKNIIFVFITLLFSITANTMPQLPNQVNSESSSVFSSGSEENNEVSRIFDNVDAFRNPQIELHVPQPQDPQNPLIPPTSHRRPQDPRRVQRVRDLFTKTGPLESSNSPQFVCVKRITHKDIEAIRDLNIKIKEFLQNAYSLEKLKQLFIKYNVWPTTYGQLLQNAEDRKVILGIPHPFDLIIDFLCHEEYTEEQKNYIFECAQKLFNALDEHNQILLKQTSHACEIAQGNDLILEFLEENFGMHPYTPLHTPNSLSRNSLNHTPEIPQQQPTILVQPAAVPQRSLTQKILGCFCCCTCCE